MCYHGTTKKQNLEKLDLPQINQERIENKFIYSGWEKPFLPAIGIEAPDVVDSFRWRLVPSKVKDEKQFTYNTLNARNDTLFETKSYKDFWQNRCIILLTGFFEPHYQNLSDPSTKNQSWYIKPKDDSFLKIGAIYSPFQGINTFSIITVDAGPMLAEVHNDGKRSPFILDDDTSELWLDKKLDQQTIAQVMTTYEHEERLTAYRVKDGVYNSKIDSDVPDILDPWKPTALPPLPLFPSY